LEEWAPKGALWWMCHTPTSPPIIYVYLIISRRGPGLSFVPLCTPPSLSMGTLVRPLYRIALSLLFNPPCINPSFLLHNPRENQLNSPHDHFVWIPVVGSGWYIMRIYLKDSLRQIFFFFIFKPLFVYIYINECVPNKNRGFTRLNITKNTHTKKTLDWLNIYFGRLYGIICQNIYWVRQEFFFLYLA
jgi:hypothetical protein